MDFVEGLECAPALEADLDAVDGFHRSGAVDLQPQENRRSLSLSRDEEEEEEEEEEAPWMLVPERCGRARVSRSNGAERRFDVAAVSTDAAAEPQPCSSPLESLPLAARPAARAARVHARMFASAFNTGNDISLRARAVFRFFEKERAETRTLYKLLSTRTRGNPLTHKHRRRSATSTS